MFINVHYFLIAWFRIELLEIDYFVAIPRDDISDQLVRNGVGNESGIPVGKRTCESTCERASELWKWLVVGVLDVLRFCPRHIAFGLDDQ